MAYNLESIYKSLIAEVQEIVNEAIAGGVSSDIQYHSWDSHGDITELPNIDLIGLVDWTYSENGGLSTVQAGLLISTLNDENLFKMVKILDIIREHCVEKPGRFKTWRIYDENGEQYTWFQVSDFEV